jgi:hypothetical protein
METFKRGVYWSYEYFLCLVNSFIFAMSTNLYTKIYNFLLNTKEEDITAGSVIYQGIEESPWIFQNELKSIIEFAVKNVQNQCEQGSLRHFTLSGIMSEVRYQSFE